MQLEQKKLKARFDGLLMRIKGNKYSFKEGNVFSEENSGLVKRSKVLGLLIGQPSDKGGLDEVREKIGKLKTLKIIYMTLIFAVFVLALTFISFSNLFFVSIPSFPIDFLEGITALDALSNLSILLFLGVLSLQKVFESKRAMIVQGHLDKLHHFVHVVDMHQAGKEVFTLGSREEIEANPELAEVYLNYVNDLIVLSGKIPPILSSMINDDGVAASSDRLEQLCISLSSKIWQRLDRLNRL
jgi:hypothetical protein